SFSASLHPTTITKITFDKINFITSFLPGPKRSFKHGATGSILSAHIFKTLCCKICWVNKDTRNPKNLTRWRTERYKQSHPCRGGRRFRRHSIRRPSFLCPHRRQSHDLLGRQ